ncbi:E3 ubiquitin-protein ligase SHPRH-like isoform X2 [Myzus persicae]|nr:E3 ubiquitin-protein ligase SHPRH-like isoform X2 [Myzus persicae]XP_022181796.1 E3 ubiquitin-protein ligase SHPRH-like isoform X2 [Myzus persicae]XP_022181805.1 E3 ubiquitin-protein ligase SHPRH-like isoform X2 [Myzus persicae]
MNNLQAAKFFEAIKTYHKHINDDFEQPQIIIPTLRSYQRRAVKWMVDREINNDFVKSDGSPFSGGILADEMGLGKTVEMLCCIMENTAPPEFYNQKVVIKDTKIPLVQMPSKPSTSKYIEYTNEKDLKKKSTSSSRSMLESWYNSILSEMSTVPKKIIDQDTNDVACYCKTTPPKSILVYCAMCGKGQHAQCVHFEPKPFQEMPYLCSNCWISNDRLQCKATLIVVPQSILNQWIDEIEKHIAKPGLKVYVYNGVHFDGYIQPFSFGDYDIVITSYTTLSRDLNYVADVNVENQNCTRLRYSKKYNYPQSPLPCIKWWRICLDEGQAIESATSKVCDMTLNLRSVHKWAMTGTPIQKSLNDLYGILKFLEVSPYCHRKQFLQLMRGEETVMYNCFSKLIWRSSIEDVNSELNLPKLTTEQHFLTFSQIEKYFYLSQHDDCATIFSNCVTRLFPSLDISVKNIDRKSIYTIIGPLYKLRQACVHPQAVNGQFLKIKGTMTMEKLMDVMIDRCRLICNEFLRSLVSQHNALAGLYLIRSEPDIAVEHYRTVLGLMEKYKDKQLKIDTCQKIHVMYNLATVLDENTTLSHGLNDSDLKRDMELLEKEYLDASKQNIESTRKTVMFYSDKVAKIIENKTLGYSDWWSDMLDWIFSPNDFLAKVQMELEDYRVPGVPNIANRLKSVNDVYNILSVWLADLDTARIDTISKLRTLEETPMNDLVQSALICHLRLKAKKGNSKNRRCLLCKAEMELQLYESLLFSVSNKQKNTLNDKTEEKDQETMYESTSKGLWKMSQKEFLLMKLFQYGQAKIINKSCLEDAAEHMKVLELVRKEFRYLRLLWTHLSDSLSAHDEIVMAKSRLRLGDNITPEADEDGPPKKKSKREEENDIVLEQYVDYNLMSLTADMPTTQSFLEKQIGTLFYLENLKKEKENSTEVETCPICCLNGDAGWAVLLCGHSVCNQCLATMCNHSDTFDIPCPMCRNITTMDLISYAKNNRDGDVPNIVLKGSFSTKIESITLKLLELITQDPNVKVLIFSNWDKALNLLGEAFDQNAISYGILKTGSKYKKTLKDFKSNKKINALLMKLSLGSKGLNLTEATRIFFMEPIINKADEHQAIGRIHRIGQTKPTFVHNFIIRDSIEENITNLFSGDMFDRWDDITLSQLIKVFERNESNSILEPNNAIRE